MINVPIPIQILSLKIDLFYQKKERKKPQILMLFNWPGYDFTCFSSLSPPSAPSLLCLYNVMQWLVLLEVIFGTESYFQ